MSCWQCHNRTTWIIYLELIVLRETKLAAFHTSVLILVLRLMSEHFSSVQRTQARTLTITQDSLLWCIFLRWRLQFRVPKACLRSKTVSRRLVQDDFLKWIKGIRGGSTSASIVQTSSSQFNGYSNYSSQIRTIHIKSRHQLQYNMSSSKNRMAVENLLNEANTSRRGDANEFICTVNKCNRKFVSEESLLAHQRRSHAPPTANVCSHCKSSFSTVPNLNKHVSFIFHHFL